MDNVTVQFLPCVYYHDQALIVDSAQCNPAIFSVGVVNIIQGQCQWIAKYTGRFGETYSMFE